MAVNEEVALLLTATDRSQAAFTTFVRGLLGVSGGYKGTAEGAKALAAANKILVVDQDKVAAATDKYTLSLMRQKAADNSAATAKLIYNKSVRDSTAQQQAALAGTAGIERANKEATASLRALEAQTIAMTRAQKEYNAAQFGLGPAQANVGAANGALRRAQFDLRTRQEQNSLLRADLTAKYGTSNQKTYDPADIIKLRQAESSLSQAKKNVVSATVAQTEAGKKLQAQNNLLEASDVRLQEAEAAVKASTVEHIAALDKLNQLKAQAVVDTDLLAKAEIDAARAEDVHTAALIRQEVAARAAAAALKSKTVAEAGSMVAGPAPAAAGLLARVGPLAGLAAGVSAILVGINASKKGLAFDAAENQIVAQTTASLAQVKAAGNVVLDYAATGKSQFDPTTLIKGALLPLTQGLPAATVAAVLPLLAQQSAIIKAPDLTLSGQGLVSIAGFAGTGSRTTAAQAASYIDMVTAAEKRIPAPPAAFTSALPKLLASTSGSGISLPDIFGAEVQGVRTTGATPSVMAGWIGQLVRSSVIKPTPAAVSLAKKLNIDLGAKGLAEAGGNPFVYWSNIFAAIGGNKNQMGTLLGATPAEIKADNSLTPAQLASQLISGGGGGSGINALRAFLALNKNMQGAAQLSDVFSAAGGATGTANQALLQGQQQRLTGVGERLNADLTKMGLTINEHVLPALTDFTMGLLSATEGIVSKSSDFFSWVGSHTPGGIGTIGKGLAAMNPAVAQLMITKYFTDKIGLTGPSTGGLAAGLLPGTPKLDVQPIHDFTGGRRLVPIGNGHYMDPNTRQVYNSPNATIITAPTNSSFLTNALAQGASISESSLLRTVGSGLFNPRGVAGSGGPTDPFIPLDTGQGRAYKQNLFQDAGALRAQDTLRAEMDRSQAVADKYKVTLAQLNQALADGANSGVLDKLRNQLEALLKDPALALGLQPGAMVKLINAQGTINRSVQRAEDKQSYVAVGYSQANALFKADVQAGKGASVLKPLADYIQSLMKDPIFARLHPKDLAARITQETGMLSHDINTATNRDVVNAAQMQLNAATIFYNGVQIHHGSLSQLNAASYQVYNSSVDLAKAQNLKKLDPQKYKNDLDQALNTLNQSLIQNIQGPMAEAAAHLSLAQQTGGATSGVIAELTQYYKVQDKDRPNQLALDLQGLKIAGITGPMAEAQAGLTLAQDKGTNTAGFIAQLKKFYQVQDAGKPQQLALDLYNLVQNNMKAPLPGPQLLRPNTAGSGSLDATFTGSISRLSSEKSSSESTRIAQLEREISQRDKEIAFLRDLLGEQRKGTAALQSIDRKTGASGKSGQPSNNIHTGLGNMRVPA